MNYIFLINHDFCTYIQKSYYKGSNEIIYRMDAIFSPSFERIYIGINHENYR